MGINEIAVEARHVDRMVIVRPSDRLFWEGVELDADGRHALVLGDSADGLILTGKLDEIAAVIGQVGRRISKEQMRLDGKAVKKTAKKARKKARQASEDVGAVKEGALGEAPDTVTAATGITGFLTTFLRPGAAIAGGRSVVPSGCFGVRMVDGSEIVGSATTLAATGAAMVRLADEVMTPLERYRLADAQRQSLTAQWNALPTPEARVDSGLSPLLRDADRAARVAAEKFIADAAPRHRVEQTAKVYLRLGDDLQWKSDYSNPNGEVVESAYDETESSAITEGCEDHAEGLDGECYALADAVARNVPMPSAGEIGSMLTA